MANWYLQNGKDSDVVISSRVRLARNLVEYNFPNKHLKDESKEVLNKLEEITPSLGYGLKFLKLENILALEDGANIGASLTIYKL